MVRKYILGLCAALALAGCAASGATYPAPISYPATPRVVPSGPNIYDSAPRAVVFNMLAACNGGGGSNIGEINYRGESLAFTPYIDTPAGPLLRNPTEGACLSSGFGWRGALSNGRQHNGLDLANPNGGFIYAAGDGRVRYADYRGAYGNVVEIDHGRGVRTLYAHLSEINQRLAPGEWVTAGAAIGRMGMTGNATGVHLHYEVWVDGMLVDPLHYGRPPVYVSAPQPEPLAIDEYASEPETAYEPTIMDANSEREYPPPVTLQPPMGAQKTNY